MMRGAWLVLCACALSLARAERDTAAVRVTPMPADHELNAKWLDAFRQDLLRDAYDDDTSPKPPSSAHRTVASLVYRPETTSEATRPGADHTSEKVPLPALWSLSTRRTTGSRPARRDGDDVGHSSGEAGPPLDASASVRAASQEVKDEHMPDDLHVPFLGCLSASVEHSKLDRPIDGHTSGEPGPPPDAPVRRRATLATIAPGHRLSRLPQDAQSRPLVERLSGRPPARHLPDDASVEHSTLGRPIVKHTSDKPPARSPDDAASRELGISRRDLYGGRRHGSITDIELDARRQPFLDTVRELDDQMIPVVVPHAVINNNQVGHNRKSRKRLWHANSEYEDKPPYIIDKNGVKRYRVHTDARERYFNQFGGDEPELKEEWGFPDFDREMRLKENRDQQRSDENPAQNDDEQDSRDESGARDEGISVSSSNELNVSEYHQENVRSRYIQDERPEREYARRFSARRDAALLADGLASSKKPCNCETEHPPIVPEL